MWFTDKKLSYLKKMRVFVATLSFNIFIKLFDVLSFKTQYTRLSLVNIFIIPTFNILLDYYL